MRVSIIAAMARNNVIGTDAGLPWHLPHDLRLFRTLTIGKPVVLGRKTLEHIGHPLPNRANVVLTRQSGYGAVGVRVVHSVSEALRAAGEEAVRLGADEVMIIGGGEIYRAFLPIADRIYLTVVGGEFEGTATFPTVELGHQPFIISSHETYPADAKNSHPRTFWQLDRHNYGSADLPIDTPLPRLLGVA